MSKDNGDIRSFGRLAIEDIEKMWPNLYDIGIEAALPPTSIVTPERRGNVLSSIKREQLTVWIGMRKGNLNCVITTVPNVDTVTRDTNLLIYSLVFIQDILPADMRWGFQKLKDYAKKEGYGKLTAYSNNDFIKKFFTSQGGQQTAVLEMEV